MDFSNLEVNMKYEVPVCELIKLTDEDIISTSVIIEGGDKGDTEPVEVEIKIGGPNQDYS